MTAQCSAPPSEPANRAFHAHHARAAVALRTRMSQALEMTIGTLSRGNILNPPESDPQRGYAEADLLERLRGMDAVAWSRVTRHYRRGILYACLRMVRNQADAEDICSQAFVRAVSQ